MRWTPCRATRPAVWPSSRTPAAAAPPSTSAPPLRPVPPRPSNGFSPSTANKTEVRQISQNGQVTFSLPPSLCAGGGVSLGDFSDTFGGFCTWPARKKRWQISPLNHSFSYLCFCLPAAGGDVAFHDPHPLQLLIIWGQHDSSSGAQERHRRGTLLEEEFMDGWMAAVQTSRGECTCGGREGRQRDSGGWMDVTC